MQFSGYVEQTSYMDIFGPGHMQTQSILNHVNPAVKVLK